MKHLQRVLLKALEKDRAKGPVRDGLRYYFTMFGTPGEGRWGLSMEGQFTEMAEYNPFRDEVWPKFLRGNAIRILKLDEKLGLTA